MLLGIDASKTSTGYSIVDSAGNLIEAGTIPTSTQTGIPIERYRIISKEIRSVVKTHNIRDIAVEGVVFGTGEKYRQVPALYALYIILQIALAELECRVVYFAPTQWKKILWQPSRWRKKKNLDLDMQIEKHEYESQTKAAVVDKVKNDYGYKLKSDEADSFCVALAGRTFFGYMDGDIKELTIDEQEVFFKKRKIKGVGEISVGLVDSKNRLWFDFGEPIWNIVGDPIRKVGFPKKG